MMNGCAFMSFMMMTTLLLLIYTKYSTPCHLKKTLSFAYIRKLRQ